MTTDEREELKANIETLAKEEGKTPVEIITLMQTGCVVTKNETLLEDLCEIKWDYFTGDR